MMNDRETRKYEMLARVREFGTNHPTIFTPGSLAADLLAQISASVDQLSNHSVAQATGTGTAREGTANRAVARDMLRSDLEAISRTARAMARQVPNVAAKFKLPPLGRDQSLLDVARTFLADAEAFREEFAKRELTDVFFAKLASDITEFERAMSTQRHGRETRIEAGAAIESTIAVGLEAVRQLDSIVRNKLGRDAAAVTAWTSASRVQREDRSERQGDHQPVGVGKAPEEGSENAA